MKVLVTGVSGFVGGRIAEGLAAAGHEVRGFVRAPERWTNRPPGTDIVVGDVTLEDSFVGAAEGCDAIVHAAALVKSWTRYHREYDRVNVHGMQHAVQAARVARARLLYVSSFIALGPTDGLVLDERSPRATIHFHNDYERTKWMADQIARRLSTGLWLVRLYPGVVYGPGALSEGNHVVRLLLQHARGKLPGVLGRGNQRQCFAFIDDVVEGARVALERGRPGAGYVLGGENRTVLDLFEAFAAATGIPPPRRRIPFALAVLAGRAQRWRANLLGIPPSLTDEVVEIYRHEWAYSSRLAERELGYRITPFAEGIRRTVAWLRASGQL